MDPRIDKLARVMVHYALAVKKDDLMMISGPSLAEPAIRAVYREALRAGANPFLRIRLPGIDELFFRHANDDQLAFISEIARLEYEKMTAMMFFWGDWNTREMTTIDPARMAQAAAARRVLTQRFNERTATGELRWVGTQFPTYASAQDAEMSLAEYEDFVYGAGHLDEDDPVAAWQQISRTQAALVQRLSQVKVLRITGRDTDLAMRVEGRTWVNCDGHINFPDGEIFTGPVEDSVEGTIRFTFPAVRQGKEVEDVVLRFAQGKVVEARARKNQDFLEAMLNLDDGARRVGEFSFGTNYQITRFTKNTLFDEKIGGTVHLAVGFSIPESGGKNLSALHWDMVCDLRAGGAAYGDGTLIYKDGRFIE